MTMIVAELQIEYIRALLGRLRSSDSASLPRLCDRIEANLDILLELVVDPPPGTLADAVAAVEAAEDRVLGLALAHAASEAEFVAPPASPAEAEPGDAAEILPEVPAIEPVPIAEAQIEATEYSEEYSPPTSGTDPEPTPKPIEATAEPRSRRPARPLGPPTTTCDPGCGKPFGVGLEIAEHRRGCAEYQAAIARRVTVLPSVTTAPLPETAPDVIAARNAFQERRREQASRAAKANRGVVARAVPVPEADVLRRKRGGRGAYGMDGLTDVQRETIEALRTNKGNISATARATHRESKQVRVTIDSLRLSRRLPADVAELLDARRQEFPGTGAD